MRNLMFIVGLLFSGFAFSANQTLCNELSIDPLGRGYSSATTEQIADDLNTEYRSQWKECVDGSDLLDAIESADWVAITDAQQDQVLSLLAIGCLDPQKNARTMMIRIFGSGSNTISNMAALGQESITRAQELGLQKVKPAHILECN